mmetsp:Transcript_5517/g.7431  ORF Transcript_5517/g.7431 Transcript_5517/m.7431 type:complete len:271 (+) Transcript_5517:50-862(+)
MGEIKAEPEIVLGTSVMILDDLFGNGLKTLLTEGAKGTSWTIAGKDTQVLATTLDPGQEVHCEPGSMMFMHKDMGQEVDCGCDTCWARCCSGESCVKTIYKNEGARKAYIGFSPRYPSNVIPVDLKMIRGETFTAKPGAYMANIGPSEVSYSCHCFDLECLCCSGLGCVRQELSGTGTAFLNAAGTILTKELADGETMIVDSDSLVGYDSTITTGVRSSGNCKVCCCGGEGCVNSTVTGPGRVFIQSTSFLKMQAHFAPVPEQDEGSNDN